MNKGIITAALILACTMLTTAAYVTATNEPAKSTPAKWEPATIMGVKPRPPAAGEQASVIQYDVTVRVRNVEYVVLYVPPEGTVEKSVEYHVGMDGLVLVGEDTMKYNDMLGNTRELPTISRRAVAAAPPASGTTAASGAI